MNRIQVTKHILEEWCEKNMNVHTDWTGTRVETIDTCDSLDVLYVCGVKLSQMDADTVTKLIDLGFTPGSPNDTNYYWENLTQEEWEQRWPFLTDCFHSYKYGSC